MTAESSTPLDSVWFVPSRFIVCGLLCLALGVLGFGAISVSIRDGSDRTERVEPIHSFQTAFLTLCNALSASFERAVMSER